MKNIINQIIEMDQKAKQITDAAQQEKLEAERDIEKRAEALRTEYLDRARRRACINSETERTIAEQKWKRRAAQFDEQERHLDTVYEQEGDRLVAQLVARVLEGDAT